MASSTKRGWIGNNLYEDNKGMNDINKMLNQFKDSLPKMTHDWRMHYVSLQGGIEFNSTKQFYQVQYNKILTAMTQFAVMNGKTVGIKDLSIRGKEVGEMDNLLKEKGFRINSIFFDASEGYYIDIMGNEEPNTVVFYSEERGSMPSALKIKVISYRPEDIEAIESLV